MNKLFRIVFGSGIGLAIAAALTLSSVGQVSADTGGTPVPVSLPFLAGVNVTTNVYESPSADSNIVGQLFAGQSWYVAGTDTTGNWTEVTLTSVGISGWVPTNTLQLYGNTLPVIPNVTGSSTTASAPAASSASAAPAASSSSSAATVTLPFMVAVNTTTNIYESPSTDSNIVGQLAAGQTWYVIGTDSTGKWTEVEITSTGVDAWVPTNTLALNGAVLPMIAGVTGS